MHIGVLAETGVFERRVSLTPSGVRALFGEGHAVAIESGAGVTSGFPDQAYADVGAYICERGEVIDGASVVITVNGPDESALQLAPWSAIGSGHVVVGLHDPLARPGRAEALAATDATAISLELVPRITRAQSMDVLSSMATVAGYQAVLLGSTRIQKMIPMLMTTAGTVPPARFLVLGAGVAGLQAIASARRLGAVVEAYDIRPAAQEQIRSLGAKAVDLELADDDTEDAGGYATEQSDDQNRRQHELLAPHVADADVVITTAAVPGAASPELVTPEMIESMRPGSVIVDLAAELGGNTRLTRADDEVEHRGVLILGPTDLTSRAPMTASQMFSTNIVSLLRHLAPDGELVLDLNDEITAGTVLTMGGEVRHPAVRSRLGLPEVSVTPPNQEEEE